jgi:predicted transcriptional regulator
MTIILTPETENRLLQQAERIGKDVNSLADALIANGLSNGAFADDYDHLTSGEIAEIRAGIERGLEAATAGRVKPLAQAVAEARLRHGFPATWASGADGTA